MYDCMKNFRIDEDTDKNLKKVLKKNKSLTFSDIVRDALRLKLDELLKS